MDADTLPMVVPFVHTGMQDIMPVGASVPRIGKTVSISESPIFSSSFQAAPMILFVIMSTILICGNLN